MINEKEISRIIVSRTDSIGDVMLTLPLCIRLKTLYPNATLIYLCASYTQSIVACFGPVDEILTIETLTEMDPLQRKSALKADVILHVFPNKKVARWANEAKIPWRVGTSHRLFHWWYCNKRVAFTRKKSVLSEAQLNFFLLLPLRPIPIPTFEEIRNVQDHFKVKENHFLYSNYVILHPFSKGSAVEYPLMNYVQLAEKCTAAGYQVLITGTATEAQKIGSSFDGLDGVTNVAGQFTLQELMPLIKQAQGFVACSTGPLHIAGALNVKTIGLFAPRKPIDPGRWTPLGARTHCLVYDPSCQDCAADKACKCVEKIEVQHILNGLLS